MESIIVEFDEDESYPVYVGAGELQSQMAAEISKEARKLAIVSDENVFSIYGDSFVKALSSSGAEVIPVVIPAGEASKNFGQLETVLDAFAAAGIVREDLVIAFGGGVVGDLSGMAASLYMRGLAYIQVPTSLLAMIDSSVGGKTAVNLAAGKNLAGTFHHPLSVWADISVLRTLEEREFRAGLFEMIKHGAVGGHDLLTDTQSFLRRHLPLDSATDFDDPTFVSELESLILRNIRQKAKIVNSDPRESPDRSDARSRKILNFGHTVGHALEKVTEFSYFRHGEAVALGMRAALEIGKMLDITAQDDITLLNDVVSHVGGIPPTGNIEIESVMEALKSDKKSSGGILQWVLLEKIGRPRIVSGDQVPDSLIRESLSNVFVT